MDKAGFTPSDLARAAWGSTTNKKGNSVALKRDRIERTISPGPAYPTPENLQLLAGRPRHPGRDPDDPGVASASAAERDRQRRDIEPDIKLPAQPSKVRLQVDRVIHWRLAEHIHRLLKEAETGEVTTVDETTLGEIVGGTDTEAQADISDAK